ncbi:MAG: hypothetical protein GEU80_00670 [Dehalococcoidia bacterium]|nr:hypothetical protein [Dehalococcoidia bacterium]
MRLTRPPRWVVLVGAAALLLWLALNALATASDPSPAVADPILLDGAPPLALASPTVPPREGTPEVVLMRAVSTRVGGGDGTTVPSVQLTDRVMQPVDPVSLEPLAGWPPLDVSAASEPTVSPDRQFAALIDWDANSLGIVDLEVWSGPRWVEVPDQFWPRGWSPDSSALLSAATACTQPLAEGRCGEEWRHEVWSVDPEAASASMVAELDAWPDELLVRDASTAVLLMHRGDVCCGIEVQGEPFVAILDLGSGTVVAEIPLPDLVVGQRIEEREHGTFGTIRRVALALHPDGRRLYIAHADEDRVAVVDLEAEEVETFDLARERSLFSRLGGWLLGGFVSTAEAKGGLNFRKQMAVSADGSRLYIAGIEDHTCPDHEYFGCRSGVPLGLQVVDTASMQVVHEEPGIGRFEVAPGGRWLLGSGRYYEEVEGEDQMALHAFGLKVLDLQTNEVVRHLWPGEPIVRVTLAPDGRHAYVVTYGSHHLDPPEWPLECEESCYRLAILDLNRGTVMEERDLGPEVPGIEALGGASAWWW